MFLLDEVKGDGFVHVPTGVPAVEGAAAHAAIAAADRHPIRVRSDGCNGLQEAAEFSGRRSSLIPVSYKLQTWQSVSGMRQRRGTLRGETQELQALVCEAAVVLVTGEGEEIELELTDVRNRRAGCREPRRF